MKYFHAIKDGDERSPLGSVVDCHSDAGIAEQELWDLVAQAEWRGRPLVDLGCIQGRLVGGLPAHFPRSFVGRWFSTDARRVIDRFRGPRDAIQWLEAELSNEEGNDPQPYWLLHFPERVDSANLELSTSGPGGLIKVVLSAGKVNGRHVFPSPAPISDSFYVSEPLRTGLVELGVPEWCFLPAPVAT